MFLDKSNGNNLVFFYVFICSFALLLNSCKENQDSTLTTNTSLKFEALTSEQTGVNFENRLDEGLNTNVLVYEYFYNGGGVAAADFNSDGFQDLYFTSNMGENKLYLNESTSGFSFKDVSSSCGAQGRNGPWKTGVSIVDINADGKPDIYVCYSGSMPDDKRRNQLFINTTPLGSYEVSFEEKAAEYGLDSPGYTSMAYFFDYDRDGDLDAILLNHNPKNLPNLNETQTKELLATPDNLKGTRLYKNENNKFIDVTEQSNVNGSELSYGLGLGISDVNQDGWPDFYVSNDYNVPDYLYINNKNGTFTNVIKEAMTHTSHFSMGNDIADINNDGLTDIMTLDMLPEDNSRQKLLLAPDNWPKYDLNVRNGFHHQFMRNMLHVNNGNGTFLEMGQIAGISNTDWSWSALFADYDNDGWKDLYITNGYLRDFTNLDFINFMDQKIKEKGRFMREDVLEIIEKMPASDVKNYMFKGSEDLKFDNVSQSSGFTEASNSNGAVYVDLDNDGDLDLIVNNINKPASIFKNESQKDNNHLMLELKGEGKNTLGIGATVSLYAGNQQWMVEQNLGRGFQSSVSPILHVGLGKTTTLDSVVIKWPLGISQTLANVKANQRLYLNELEGTRKSPTPAISNTVFTKIDNPINFKDESYEIRDFDRQALIFKDYSKHGPCMKKADLNGDAIEDIILGGSKGQTTKVYFQNKSGQFTLQNSKTFEADKECHDTSIEVFDANGDSHPDIFIGSGGYHDFTADDPRLVDRLYINDGKGNFQKSDMNWKDATSTGKAKANDINGDGFEDLFIGGRLVPGSYPQLPQSYILINDGKGQFLDKTKDYSSEISTLGMVTDAAWVDLDGDKNKELIVVGEWMPLSVYSLKNGKMINSTAEYFDADLYGLWNSITVADLNKDGKPDFLFGNIGLNHQLKASPERPTELFYSDFDKNGSIDPILCTYIMNQSYPFVTRDELLKQVVPLKKKFTDYTTFSTAKLENIFSKAEISNANKLKSTHFETMLYLSTKNKKYVRKAIPDIIQSSSVYAAAVLDVNSDGHVDMITFGNDTYLPIKLGMMTANRGQVFLGDGQGNFTYLPQHQSGLNAQGDVRTVVVDGNKVIIGASGSALQTYEIGKIRQ